MNWSAVLGLLAGVGLGLTGARMVTRARSYIGEGSMDARDPRTVRIFGTMFVLMGAVVLILSILRMQRG